jgi:hypothetical protein
VLIAASHDVHVHITCGHPHVLFCLIGGLSPIKPGGKDGKAVGSETMMALPPDAAWQLCDPSSGQMSTLTPGFASSIDSGIVR